MVNQKIKKTPMWLRVKTKEETETLFKAQRDFIKYGKTDIKCPRCGKKLNHYCEGSEETSCGDPNCIGIIVRGI
ncbi:hypothetical protein FACS1894105_07610 [Clostridia bacterium]|nr:hypothetical protein FACS1894105_07610 [Clostridia bacterium]